MPAVLDLVPVDPVCHYRFADGVELDLGGEAVDRGLWPVFLLLASFNLFMALFNLLPLLPLDGGHIMIAWYEKLRGRGPVDYTRLLPLTVALMLVGGAVMLLSMRTDLFD